MDDAAMVCTLCGSGNITSLHSGVKAVMEQYDDSTFSLHNTPYQENGYNYRSQSPEIEQSVELLQIQNNINSGYVPNYRTPLSPPQSPLPIPPESIGKKIYRIFFKDPLPVTCMPRYQPNNHIQHSSQPDIYCGSCGEKNLMQAVFCTRCGSNIR